MVERAADYLRVELRTTWFIDDCEFLLDLARQLIEVRSASWVGYSDLGKNRRRLEGSGRNSPARGPHRNQETRVTLLNFQCSNLADPG